MKKRSSILVFSALLFCGGISFSQSFSLVAMDTLVYGAPDPSKYLYCPGAKFINNTSNVLILDILRIKDVDTAASHWKSAFCLDMNCYTPEVDSVQLVLVPSNPVYFLLDFEVTSTPDSQTVVMKIRDTASPYYSVSQSFHGVTQNGYGVKEEAKYRANVLMYPSPVTSGDNFTMNITDIKSKSKEISLVVYNIYGSEVSHITDLREGNNILHLDLAAGLYSYSLVSGNESLHSGKIAIVQ